MEHFVVSARKYRPRTFDQVVGQQHVARTLENAIENNQLAQAMLFCGPRGVGKTTCARILAREINRRTMPDAQDEDFAFNIHELDAASNNSVEDIRALIDQVRFAPQTGKYKVYIIDEVHMLSQAAFNAFLKTLEEPPAHAIFILATTEKHKILPTILSRCQIFDFKLISVEDIREHLARIAADQGVTADGESLHMIATKAEGALRDALSIYDRVVSFCGRELTGAKVAETLNVLDYQTYFDLTDAILGCDIPSAMLQFDKILRTGFDAQYMLSGLASHIRDLMVSKNPATVSLLTVPDDVKARYSQQASRLDCDAAVEALTILAQAQAEYRLSKNPRLLTEITLMRLASLGMDPSKKKSPDFIIPPQVYRHFSSALPSREEILSFIGELRSGLQVPFTEKKLHSPAPQAQNANPQIRENQPAASENKPVAPAHISTPHTGEKKPAVELRPTEITAIKARSALSISNMLAPKKEPAAQETEESEERKDDAFTCEQLLSMWSKYASQAKDDKRIGLYTAMCSADVSLEENHTIGITVSSTVIAREIEDEILDILRFLKDALNNTQITHNITVSESAREHIPYTPREKYEYLRLKNPLIEELRRTLDLNIDF